MSKIPHLQATCPVPFPPFQLLKHDGVTLAEEIQATLDRAQFLAMSRINVRGVDTEVIKTWQSAEVE